MLHFQPLRHSASLRPILPRVRSLFRRRLGREPGQGLVLLDDVFPHRLSAFRISEFNAYLETYRGSLVYSTARGFACLGETRGFPEVVEEYERHYPDLSGRVAAFDARRRLAGDLAYMVFLNNARYFLDTLDRDRIPFAFTLYPGGGFDLEAARTDAALRRVLGSRWFRKVIVTQTVTRDYLLARSFCDPSQIEFIYGGVFPAAFYTAARVKKLRYGRDKGTLDICFVAHKYMPAGLDKGYDVFVAVAKALAGRHPEIRFHVVGPYDASDVDVGEIADRVRFHGVQTTDFFAGFYAGMDIILSPNAPFVRGPGQFDGFPTGCCIEAGLCGVAVFCTDLLRLNDAFEDGREIVIVSRDPGQIAARIEAAVDHPEDLSHISESGREAFARVFDPRAQLEPRLRLIDQFMGAAAVGGAG